MVSGQDSQDVGRHTLGPHVVGTRVVVRRLLRGQSGPTGGPAFTDVLGVCTAWGDGVCVVAPETGPAVTVPIADIVSGKPVPPRPAVRHRVSAREAESHALVLWPHVDRQPLGEWELRSDPAPVGRPLKRTNSCLAIGDPGLPLAEAEQVVRDFYAARSRRPLVQVETGSEINRHLTDAGWTEVPGGASYFQLASVSRLSRTLRTRTGPVAGLAEDGPRAEVEIRAGEELLGRARAGLSGDWLGLHGFSVDPAHRRRGLARRMLAELIDWGAAAGATTAWLHVETDNAPALALYEGTGFRTHHALRYLSPG